MARLERRDDALDPAAVVKRRERFVVGDRQILRAAAILEPRVLGSHTGIVETRRHRVRFENLAVCVLQQVRAIAMQHARTSRC